MSILLALYSVIKYIFSLIFKGPLNFNVEFLFWIFNGVLFGPLKGTIFSMICDTTFLFFTTGIGYWMIEYAIVPPLVTITSWLLWKTHKENNKASIWISTVTILLLIASTLTIFSFQLLKGKIRYENVSSSKLIPEIVFSFIVISCFLIITFLVVCLFLYKFKQDWKYIKWLHSLMLIVVVVILFRWLWGPYAYIEWLRRFNSKQVNFAKQYVLSLFGIVTKTSISIPIGSMLIIPMISIVERFNNNNIKINRYT